MNPCCVCALDVNTSAVAATVTLDGKSYCGQHLPVAPGTNHYNHYNHALPTTQSREQVNHPAHYTKGGIEAITVIDAWDLDFCLGNTVKYISRAGRKDPDQEIVDLKKARWYLDHAITMRENAAKK